MKRSLLVNYKIIKYKSCWQPIYRHITVWHCRRMAQRTQAHQHRQSSQTYPDELVHQVLFFCHSLAQKLSRNISQRQCQCRPMSLWRSSGTQSVTVGPNGQKVCWI